ncbi:NACHT%2C LRR and PYD domains-containing protein 1b allele 3-like, partial [Scomber scombrus]
MEAPVTAEHYSVTKTLPTHSHLQTSSLKPEFSGFGIVKDEDSPPDPVRALVLLFYRPLTDADPESVLNVLLLPKNIVMRHVWRTRNERDRDERFIEISPHCKLIPKQEYTLSSSPEDDSVLVQPKEAEFDEESYDNYFPSLE